MKRWVKVFVLTAIVSRTSVNSVEQLCVTFKVVHSTKGVIGEDSVCGTTDAAIVGRIQARLAQRQAQLNSGNDIQGDIRPLWPDGRVVTP